MLLGSRVTSSTRLFGTTFKDATLRLRVPWCRPTFGCQIVLEPPAIKAWRQKTRNVRRVMKLVAVEKKTVAGEVWDIRDETRVRVENSATGRIGEWRRPNKQDRESNEWVLVEAEVSEAPTKQDMYDTVDRYLGISS